MYADVTRRPNRSVLTLSLLLLPLIAAALPEDREQPITLEADSAQYDQNTGKSTYQGNVVVTQGSMHLEAAQATVIFKDGSATRMEATGKPARFSYRPKRDKPPIQGVGNKVVYNVAEAKVVVTGAAQFTQGGDEFKGERIEYDLSRDLVSADGGRVRFIIQPGTLKQGN